jgi:poly-gamma-glutamate capsule biosynthesis protein CapA/YwtB (metallophosphatase superfamily)
MRRRAFLRTAAGLLGGVAAIRPGDASTPGESPPAGPAEVADGPARSPDPRPLTLFLAGDVMTGRGVDQALPFSADPVLYERHVRTAQDYVALAEAAHGPLPRPLDFAYPWGDALGELERVHPALRLANLETAVTDRGEYSLEKGIHYRMHPGNVPCLEAAGFDAVSLANNHVLDWGVVGLEDTLRSLGAAGIRFAGAGPDRAAAAAPCVFETHSGRVLFFAACTAYSGVPRSWAAGPGTPGVNRVDLTVRSVRAIAEAVERARQPGDMVILSLHWDGNWGYRIDPDRRDFAHRLIDEAGIDLLHGHSSHHPKGIELYRGKAILYGCGDFLNDYEGIRGDYGAYRGELTAMYFPTLEPGGEVVRLELVPLRIHRFRLQHATDEEAAWLTATLDRESRKLGARAERDPEGRIRIQPA